MDEKRLKKVSKEIFKFYQSAEWKNVRKSYMVTKHYICERCGQPAYICHHKKYITIKNINDPNITLSFSNLEELFLNCHNKESFKQKNTFLFNEFGDLVPPLTNKIG